MVKNNGKYIFVGENYEPLHTLICSYAQSHENHIFSVFCCIVEFSKTVQFYFNSHIAFFNFTVL